MIDYNKIKVTIDTNKLISNYRLLSSKGSNLLPVIKSDAYGHGMQEVAKILAAQGADSFGVGTTEEAVKLREVFDGTIVSMLGPQEEEDYRAIAECGVIPFVFRFDQIRKLNEVAEKTGNRIPIALKFDTGMGRLGFSESETEKVTERLNRCTHLKPQMLCSHLASADVTDYEDFTREQGRCLDRIMAVFAGSGFNLKVSMANSAGLLAYPDLHYDIQRPGIALYGSNSFAGTTWQEKGEGLQSCMEVSTPIIQFRNLGKGSPISYGCTWRASRPTRAAIVASGYADLFSRGLSNKGFMLVNGKRAPVIGRVCMQMTAIDITDIPGIEIGDSAYLLGGMGDQSITPEELAEWWGTITYEVFCVLGFNKRHHI